MVVHSVIAFDEVFEDSLREIRFIYTDENVQIEVFDINDVEANAVYSINKDDFLAISRTIELHYKMKKNV